MHGAVPVGLLALNINCAFSAAIKLLVVAIGFGWIIALDADER